MADKKKQPAKKAAPAAPEAAPRGVSRSGTIAIVGRPNVGKSTFLNAALEVELAIVSKTAQTTRNTLLGVIHRELPNGDRCELLLLDTPGLHEGKTKLNHRMNAAAKNAAAEADLVVFMTDLPKDPVSAITPHREDVKLLAALPEKARVVLVINKADVLKDKRHLLGLLDGLSKLRPFEALVPVSARRADGVARVLDVVAELLPEGEHGYGDDDLTDRPMRFLAAEFVREQILRRAREEVPHAAAVSVDLFEETGPKARIAATIHVEKNGQKRILVGEGGAMLKQIGTEARKRIEEFLGRGVRLELFVRETPDWRNQPRLLGELGYDEAQEPGEASPKRSS